ncbi:MAG TPA: hypothetical protein VF595_00425 [Tepidisphaeraceae bacterium]|jgi:uncharacterized delta-60 repeat protein
MLKSDRSRPLIDSLEPRRLMAFADPIRGFGQDGYAGLGSKLNGEPLLEQTDGKLVAGVGRIDAYRENRTLLRFRADGSIDRTFGQNGYADPGVSTRRLFQVAGGKLLGVYDYAEGEGEQTRYGVGLFRLNANGSLDRTYGEKGRSVYRLGRAPFRQSGSVIRQAAVGADGAVYVGSDSDSARYRQARGTMFSVSLLKFTPDGRPDTTWAGDGEADLPIVLGGPGEASVTRTIRGLVVRDDGSLLLAGTEDRRGPDLTYPDNRPVLTARSTYLTRLTPDGRTDTTFGRGGEVLVQDPQADLYDYALPVSLVANPDTTVVLGFRANGRTQLFNFRNNGVTRSRLRSDGVREPQATTFDAVTRLKDGRLLLHSFRGYAEARRQDDGRWDVQPYRRPVAPAATGEIDISQAPLVLRDGTLLTAADPGPGSPNREAALVKLSPGDGSEPRDDFIRNAQQHSITNFDSNGRSGLRVFYYDAVDRRLEAVDRNGDGRWQAPEVIDDGLDTGLYLSGDGDGVAYFDGNHGDLKFAYKNPDGAWAIETVDSVGSVGLYPSLVRYGDDYAIAYYHRTKGDLRLARRNGSGVWTIETVDRRGDAGRLAKLRIKEHNGKFAIAYAADGDRSIRLAEAQTNGRRWAIQDVATTSGGVGGLDFNYSGFDAEFGPFDDEAIDMVVAYYDSGPADLVIARREGLGKPFNAVRVATKGAVGLRPYVGPSYLDVLFYDRTRDRVLRGGVVPGVDGVLSGYVDDRVIAQNAGRSLTVVNGGRLVDGLIIGWYDAAAGGVQIRDAE